MSWELLFTLQKTLQNVAKENNLSEIGSVTLEIGEVSTIVPDYLTDCWKYYRKKISADRTFRTENRDTPCHYLL